MESANLTMTPTEVTTRLGAAIMEAIAEGTVEGAYDAAFSRPAIRAFYVAHWALTLFVGSFIIISICQV